MSDRQVHDNLLNDPPLIHASEPDSRYRNDPARYKAVIDLLTRARIAGEIPFEAIADATRPVTFWDVFPTPGRVRPPRARSLPDGLLAGLAAVAAELRRP